MRHILLDIEGTTTSISFVHDVLFPYSKNRMASFIEAHSHEAWLLKALKEVDVTTTSNNVAAAATILAKWIEEDRKHPVLKMLQGKIWEEGYRTGAFKSHLYPDVKPNLTKWHKQSLGLSIFSSGSKEAQILLFGHTDYGDLTPLFTNFFDLSVGPKRESTSYQQIASILGEAPKDVLFLSDIEEELDAAKQCGLNTTQLVRPGTKASAKHRTVSSFDEV